MRIPLLAALAAAGLTPSCYEFKAHAQGGYALLAVDGELGYVSGAGTASISQDVRSAFGLGDDQGSPYARVSIDTGVQVLTVSGFTFDDSGEGVLQANFGDSPLLIAGAPVQSQLEMTNIKGSYLFQIDLGPVAISPGIAVDYIDLDVQVRDVIGIANERVDLQAPVPLAMLRAEVDIGFLSVMAEVGYMRVDVDDVSGSLLDIEAMLMVHPTSMVDLFVGYRSLQLVADGEIDGDAFDTDLRVGGLVFGGGLRF